MLNIPENVGPKFTWCSSLFAGRTNKKGRHICALHLCWAGIYFLNIPAGPGIVSSSSFKIIYYEPCAYVGSFLKGSYKPWGWYWYWIYISNNPYQPGTGIRFLKYFILMWPVRLRRCYHVLNWFFLPKPGFLEFIWIFSGRTHFKINISHILNPNLTK